MALRQITVVVHPNSRKPRMETDLTGMIHVYVKAPPLEGKANEEVLESLAEFLKIKKSGIILAKGHKAKVKTFYIK